MDGQWLILLWIASLATPRAAAYRPRGTEPYTNTATRASIQPPYPLNSSTVVTSEIAQPSSSELPSISSSSGLSTASANIFGAIAKSLSKSQAQPLSTTSISLPVIASSTLPSNASNTSLKKLNSTPLPPFPINDTGPITTIIGHGVPIPTGSVSPAWSFNSTSKSGKLTSIDTLCTVNVPDAHIEWWYGATFYSGVGSFTRFSPNLTSYQGPYLTLKPNTGTSQFDAASAITSSSAFSEHVTYDSVNNNTWTDYVLYTITPAAATTSIVERNYIPTLPPGNFIPESEVLSYLSPTSFDAVVPVAAAANSTSYVTSATPFAYFSTYEVTSTRNGTPTTQTITLARPTAIEYAIPNIESSASASGSVPDALMQAIPQSTCVPGTIQGPVTVLVVVDLVYIFLLHVNPFIIHLESTVLGWGDDDTVMVAQATSQGTPFLMSMGAEPTQAATEESGWVEGSPEPGETPRVGGGAVESSGSGGSDPGSSSGGSQNGGSQNGGGQSGSNQSGGSQSGGSQSGGSQSGGSQSGGSQSGGSQSGGSQSGGSQSGGSQSGSQSGGQSGSGQSGGSQSGSNQSGGGQSGGGQSNSGGNQSGAGQSGSSPGQSNPNVASPPRETIGTIGTNLVIVGPSSVVIVGSRTLQPGAPAVTIGGSVVSVAPSATAIVVNGQTSALPIVANPGSPTQTIGTIGGSPVIIGPSSAVVVGTQTLKPGGGAVLVNGFPVSLMPSGNAVVFGSVISNDHVVGAKTSFLPLVIFPTETPEAHAGPDPPILTIGSSTLTGNAATQFFIAPGQTLTPGGTAVIAGQTVSLDRAAAFLVVDGSTQAIASTTPFTTPPLILTIGSSTITANAATQFFIAPGQTLTPGGTAVIAGQTVSLDRAAAFLVVDGSTQAIASTTPFTTLPLILTIGSSTITANAATQFLIAPGQTLTPGGTAVIDGQTVSLDRSAHFLIVDGSTQTLAPLQTTPPLTINGQTFTPLPGSGPSFVIDGQTLTPGGLITVSGTTISLAPHATAIIVDGITTALTPSPVITNAPILIVGSHTYMPISGGAASYYINGQLLTPGGRVVANGTTISLAQFATEVVYGSAGTSTTSGLFPATTTPKTSATDVSASAGATGQDGGAVATTSKTGAATRTLHPLSPHAWLFAIFTAFLGVLFL